MFRENQTTHAILFILEKMGGVCDFHKLFKILYFADQKHLVQYGRPITGDTYIAMMNGPVPSVAYDLLKSLRKTEANSPFFEVRDNIRVHKKRSPDIEELAETDMECLLASIDENKSLSFSELSEKSHGLAWTNAQGAESIMSVLDIAKEAHASPEMLEYIQLNLENENFSLPCE